ncbi:MAG: hypothetical protein HN826_00415 [Methylococcales bacterium]|jgi:hypothetical protein|nr:hypothetical protein [Methylococcales bacterium]
MFKYIFEFSDKESKEFTVHVDKNEQPEDEPTSLPDWTVLSYKQCSNCPLTESEHCPVAKDIYKIVHTFSDVTSFEKVDVRVIGAAREYRKKCDAQTGLNSLLGLVMASSNCPILSRLKPMARFHLPFCSSDEVLIRTLSFYLMKQLFNYKEGDDCDMELHGLIKSYDELIVLNTCFAERIRNSVTQDANLNAITNFFAVSVLVPFSLKDCLANVRPLVL